MTSYQIAVLYLLHFENLDTSCKAFSLISELVLMTSLLQIQFKQVIFNFSIIHNVNIEFSVQVIRGPMYNVNSSKCS